MRSRCTFQELLGVFTLVSLFGNGLPLELASLELAPLELGVALVVLATHGLLDVELVPFGKFTLRMSFLDLTLSCFTQVTSYIEIPRELCVFALVSLSYAQTPCNWVNTLWKPPTTNLLLRQYFHWNMCIGSGQSTLSIDFLKKKVSGHLMLRMRLWELKGFILVDWWHAYSFS